MEDYLFVSPDDAVAAVKKEESKKGGKVEDPRFWKPTIDNPEKEYQAMIRMLPRGLDGLKNKMMPTIEQHTHYIKDEEHKMFLTLPCRKTLGKHEDCPICEASWAIYNTKEKALMEIAKKRFERTSHVGNFFILDDINNPANNGNVKLWNHTNRVNNTLMDPTRPDADDEPGKRSFKKKKERFTPYSPMQGRNFFVIMNENQETRMPSYDGSYWDGDGLSDLAPSKDEIMAILDQCYDLNEFLQNVPSGEELARLYADFNARLEEKKRSKLVSGAGATQHFTGSNNPAARPTPTHTTNSTVVKGDAKQFMKVEAQEDDNGEAVDFGQADPNASLFESAPAKAPAKASAPKASAPKAMAEPMITDDSEDDLPF